MTRKTSNLRKIEFFGQNHQKSKKVGFHQHIFSFNPKAYFLWISCIFLCCSYTFLCISCIFLRFSCIFYGIQQTFVLWIRVIFLETFGIIGNSAGKTGWPNHPKKRNAAFQGINGDRTDRKVIQNSKAVGIQPRVRTKER